MQSNSIRRDGEAQGLHSIVGESAWTIGIREQVRLLAACPSNVLITGPTGTGKDVIARAIHACSVRAAKPFIPVDCAAITGTLFSSLLFGHHKGAFTGATYSALGCFRAAQGGSVFLDELGEMELDMQIKLLRVLQNRTVVPLGGHEEIPIDVRVIAATNRNLEKEVAQGAFREDLYYRLNVVSLATAPLSERPDDIEALAQHFLNKLAITHGLPLRAISAEALDYLKRDDWPGNVRQLENVLERAAFLGAGLTISKGHLIDGRRPTIGPSDYLTTGCIIPFARDHMPAVERHIADDATSDCMAVIDGKWRTMKEVECEYIRRTLALTNLNQSAAARLLGMERHQLARKIRNYGLVSGPSKSKRTAKRAA